MDQLTRYRDIVRRLIEGYAGQKPSIGEVDSYPLIDEANGRYVAMQVGWAGTASTGRSCTWT